MSIARFPSFIYRSSILAHLHRFSIRHRFSGDSSPFTTIIIFTSPCRELAKGDNDHQDVICCWLNLNSNHCAGLAAGVLKNIKDYMVENLGIEAEKIPELCNLLYKNYGTTMAGIRAIGYDFDYDEYHSFVHGRLPYQNLKPDPILRTLLLSLPIRKVIFTNADEIHAAKVVSKLGLEDCFEGIICFETLNPVHKNTISDDEDDMEFVGSTTSSSSSSSSNTNEIFDIIGHFSKSNSTAELPKTPVVCKPSEDAIEKALKIANINPQRTLFFEDSVRNIQSGKRVGLDTVLVGTSHRCKGADYALESIHNMKEAIPELWKAEKKVSDGVYNSGKVVVETSVTA